MDDLISRQAAIDALHMHLMYRMGTDSNKKRLDEWINNLPSAQTDVPDINVGDMISRQKVRYKLTALVNELEEIFSNIRERNEDDSVCGLCEYDGAYIGQSGEWCNECPGFEKADCFKLKDKYREEWVTID